MFIADGAELHALIETARHRMPTLLVGEQIHRTREQENRVGSFYWPLIGGQTGYYVTNTG